MWTIWNKNWIPLLPLSLLLLGHDSVINLRSCLSFFTWTYFFHSVDWIIDWTDLKYSSPIFRTLPHRYNFFIRLYPSGIGPATGKCASILFTLFPGDNDNLLQWPFSKLIHIGIRDQLDPMNTWMKTIRLDQDPA